MSDSGIALSCIGAGFLGFVLGMVVMASSWDFAMGEATKSGVMSYNGKGYSVSEFRR